MYVPRPLYIAWGVLMLPIALLVVLAPGPATAGTAVGAGVGLYLGLLAVAKTGRLLGRWVWAAWARARRTG